MSAINSMSATNSASDAQLPPSQTDLQLGAKSLLHYAGKSVVQETSNVETTILAKELFQVSATPKTPIRLKAQILKAAVNSPSGVQLKLLSQVERMPYLLFGNGAYDKENFITALRATAFLSQAQRMPQPLITHTEAWNGILEGLRQTGNLIEDACPEVLRPTLIKERHALMSTLNRWLEECYYNLGLTPEHIFKDNVGLEVLHKNRSLIAEALQREAVRKTYCSDVGMPDPTDRRSFEAYPELIHNCCSTLGELRDWFVQGAEKGEILWWQDRDPKTNEPILNHMLDLRDEADVVSTIETLKLSAEQQSICKDLAKAIDARYGNPAYHPGVDRAKAKELLSNEKIGTYLIRDCSEDSSWVVISGKVSETEVHHSLIKSSLEVDLRKELKTMGVYKNPHLCKPLLRDA